MNETLEKPAPTEGNNKLKVMNEKETESQRPILSKNGSEESNIPPSEVEIYAPDDIINKLGCRNTYVLTVLSLTSFTWSITALNGLSAAFIVRNCKNCSQTISIVDEFNLRDELSYLAELTTTAFMCGNMVGGGIVSPIADRFGRRPVLLSSLFLMTLAGLVAVFSPNIYVFAGARFLQGIFYTAGALVAWVIGYESVPINMRYLVSLIFGLCWVLGYCCLTPIAYFSPTWRWIAFWVSAPHCVMGLICYFFVPESLHYLSSSSRHSSDAVRKWLRRADPNNKHGVAEIDPERIHGRNRERNDESLRIILRDIFLKHRKFIVLNTVIAYLWICDTFIYFGLSLYSTRLSGNIYTNYFLMGVVEIPAYLVGPWCMNRFGRRPIIGGTHLLAGVVFLGLITTTEGSIPALCLWLLGKSAISLSFMGIYVYASEIFPTNIRNFCIGFGETLSRFGGMAAPALGPLGHINPMIPMIILTIICFIGGFLTFILPETLGRKLPATVEEAVEKRD